MRIGWLALAVAIGAGGLMGQTQTLAFPAGGTVHVKNSGGELAVEGWNRAEVELTAVTPAKEEQLKMTHSGSEILIEAAKASRWKQAETDYRIRMPRSAKLVVDHGTGEIHVADLTGNIHATVFRGQIVLNLPAEEQYSIDARSKLGDIVSDYPGRARRRPWIFAHRFEQAGGSASTHQLYLRVGFGDILILKTIHPAAPKPLTE